MVRRRVARASLSVAACFRRLRQAHEQRRFSERQPARLLAEIGDTGGADAFQIAAERRERQIEVEDLAFAERVFELHSAHDLTKFHADRPLAGLLQARLKQPRHLHGDRRAAGNDAT